MWTARPGRPITVTDDGADGLAGLGVAGVLDRVGERRRAEVAGGRAGTRPDRPTPTPCPTRRSRWRRRSSGPDRAGSMSLAEHGDRRSPSPCVVRACVGDRGRRRHVRFGHRHRDLGRRRARRRVGDRVVDVVRADRRRRSAATPRASIRASVHRCAAGVDRRTTGRRPTVRSGSTTTASRAIGVATPASASTAPSLAVGGVLAGGCTVIVDDPGDRCARSGRRRGTRSSPTPAKPVSGMKLTSHHAGRCARRSRPCRRGRRRSRRSRGRRRRRRRPAA